LPTRFTFRKEERLCSKLAIESLFARNQTCYSYPLRMIFSDDTSPHPDFPCRVIFSVPKRLFKRAVKRNLIRRRMREAYRLNKAGFYQALEESDRKMVLLMVYTDKEVHDFATIEKGMKKGMTKLIQSGKEPSSPTTVRH
jgi:ribonuclease P protein component